VDKAKEIVENLARAVIEYDADGAAKFAREAISTGIDPLVAIEDGLAKGIQTISSKYQNGEIFVTELMIAADGGREYSGGHA
jgi:trimethylamine corrinoid protein